jgi:thiamine pyrophosphate-dependent acetolactate synthase large subunit-like protein
VRSGAGPAIGTLACALAAPVLTTYQSRGILPPEHPCAVPASVHAPEVGALWDEADVVLAVGSDLDGVNTQNWAMPAPPTLITVNVDPVDAAKNYPADLSLAGDATPIVERLAAGIAGQGDIEALGRRLKAIRDAVAVSVAADEPEAVRFLDVMGRVLDDDTVVVADMCIPGYWLGGYGRFRQPRKLAFPMGWGTLGFGFPASLGAALAGRGPVVCVCGDGGFLFACGELATVAQEHIPVTVVLVDDGGYGMLRFDQVAAGDEPFGVDLLRPDFAALAASFGVPAVTVDGFGDDFESALASAVSGGQANVIVVRARLKPPLTTSPRWYRRQPDH